MKRSSVPTIRQQVRFTQGETAGSVTAVLLRRRPVILSITIDDPGGWGKKIGPKAEHRQ